MILLVVETVFTKSTYALTAVGVTPSSPVSVIHYGYGNMSWGDQLTSYNGNEIRYDSIGNPIS